MQSDLVMREILFPKDMIDAINHSDVELLKKRLQDVYKTVRKLQNANQYKDEIISLITDLGGYGTSLIFAQWLAIEVQLVLYRLSELKESNGVQA